MSVSYQQRPERPSSIAALYPDGTRLAMGTFMRQNRHRGCVDCGALDGDEYVNPRDGGVRRVWLQATHEHHNPESLAFAARCPTCHRAHDKTHQSCGSALTMIAEGRLPHARLQERGALIRQDVARDGLGGLSPSSADLTVLCLLHRRGPQTPEQLAVRLRDSLGLSDSLEDCLDVVDASTVRLGMRETHRGEPLVGWDGERAWCTLEQISLPDVEYAPVGQHSHLSRRGRYVGWQHGDRRIYTR